MTVKEFIQEHPATSLNLMTAWGTVQFNAQQMQNLLGGKNVRAYVDREDRYTTFHADEMLAQEIFRISRQDGDGNCFSAIARSSVEPQILTKLEAADFSGRGIHDIDLSNMCFENMDFFLADFENVRFHNSIFLNCEFTEAHFTNCDLSDSLAVESCFDLGSLVNCDVKNMRMSQCTLEALQANHTDMNQLIMDRATRETYNAPQDNVREFPDTSSLRCLTQDDVAILEASHTLWRLAAGGEQADFSGCYLADLDMSGMRLDNAIFDGAVFYCTDLSHGSLRGASLRSAYFEDCQMPKLLAENADLSGATFVDCDLEQSIFMRSNLSRTQFAGSNVAQMDIRESCIEDSNITKQGGICADNISDCEDQWLLGDDSGMAGMGGMA